MKSMEATLCANNAQRNTHNYQFSHSITGISFGQIEARVTLFGDSFMIPKEEIRTNVLYIRSDIYYKL